MSEPIVSKRIGRAGLGLWGRRRDNEGAFIPSLKAHLRAADSYVTPDAVLATVGNVRLRKRARSGPVESPKEEANLRPKEEARPTSRHWRPREAQPRAKKT